MRYAQIYVDIGPSTFEAREINDILKLNWRNESEFEMNSRKYISQEKN